MWLNREYSRTQLVLGPVSAEARLIHLSGLCHFCVICRQVCGTCSRGHGQLVVIAFTQTGSMWPTHHSLSVV